VQVCSNAYLKAASTKVMLAAVITFYGTSGDLFCLGATPPFSRIQNFKYCLMTDMYT